MLFMIYNIYSGHNSNEPPTQEIQDTNTRSRYYAEHFNTNGANNEAKMDYELDNIQAENYELMAVNAPVPPPIPKINARPKKPNLNTHHSTHYVRSSEQHNVSKPVIQSHMHSKFHGRVQQQPHVRPGSLEKIYEIPL